MPLTSDADKSDELQAGRENEKRVPLAVAILVLILTCVIVGLLGWIVFTVVGG